MRFLLLAFFCCFLLSCNSKDISYNYPDNPDYARKSRAGMMFSEKGLVLYDGKKDKQKNDKKNEVTLEKSPLWKATIEVVGSMFPIAIINSDSGSVISEWYQDPNNLNERVKIHALVKAPQVEKENLRIAIFRQRKFSDKNSHETWQDSTPETSDTGALSAKLLQDKILEKASRLK